MTAGTQQWSSRFGFLMASIGFAVGLGNIWRFPYVTGENGGSAFVLVYLLCVFAIGVPILMAEIMLGRRGRKTPPACMVAVAQESGRGAWWAIVGFFGIFAATLILFAYSVVAGWVIYYLFQAITAGFSAYTPDHSVDAFNQLLAQPGTMFFWGLVPLGIAAFIVYAGVQKGIERAVVVLMPLLFFLLLGLVFFNFFAGGMDAAVRYLFAADFSKISAGVFLAAVGQAFFSIGVGMAGMMIFGAYLPRTVSISHSVIIIVIADTLVALIAGLVIFPMVFSNGLDPAGGSGLIFQTLPVAFAQMTAGSVVAVVFFLLLSVAAITSIVGLFEPVSAWIGERFGTSRHVSVVMFAAVIMLGSIVSVLSYNAWAGVGFFGVSLAGLMDFVPNQIVLPLGGFLIALFAGWFMQPEYSSGELELPAAGFALWRQLLRFVVVPAVAVIFISGLLG